MQCSKCGLEKLPTEMRKNAHKKSGFSSHCVQCSRAASTRWNREHPNRFRGNVQAYNRNYRRKVLELLGNKCVKCGFTDIRALQVDHIDGGGAKEKRLLKTLPMYRKILKTKGKGYQLLCANCNWIKRYENGEHC